MKIANLSWPELIVQLRRTPVEECAWEELQRRLMNYAFVILPAGRSVGAVGAEDLAQKALLKLLENSQIFSQLDDHASPEYYLKRLMANLARDDARRKLLALNALRQLAAQEQNDAIPRKPPEETLLDALTAEVHLLPGEQHQLLRMRFWEGMSIGEIASRAGVTYSAAAVRIFRILERLRQALATRSDQP